MKLVSGITIYLIFVAIISSCTRDMVSEVENECGEVITYDDHIRQIVDANCSYSGCHAGGGAAPGDFTSYSGMSAYFSGGALESRAVISRDMPPSYASGPTEMSAENIDLFKCWIQEGYPEN